MKNKLVTLFGGGGFLGRYIAQDLLAKGARVRVAQRDPREAWFLKTQGGLGQTQFVAADARKPETIVRALDGADAVVNVIGDPNGGFGVLAPHDIAALGKAATDHGIATLVHFSAIGADPASPARYGRLKAAGEAAIHSAFPAATIMRPSIVFGREDQFVNRFAAMIAAFPVVPVLHASAKFQPVFVGDVAAAVAAALADPAAAGQTYELGGPDTLTMGALIRWIAQAIGRNRAIVDLPDALGGLIAAGGFLPGAPITRDQWKMLHVDNVVATGAKGLADLGVVPTPLDAVAPAWLVRYRKQGRFGTRAAA